MNKQKGMGNILIRLLIIVLALSTIIYFLYLRNTDNKSNTNKYQITETEKESSENQEFKEIKEDSTTPQEINDESIQILDNLINEIDNTPQEDLSDLNL